MAISCLLKGQHRRQRHVYLMAAWPVSNLWHLWPPLLDLIGNVN